ncbi:MAG: hypothetical protein ACUVT6_09735, partial [Thermodesulfobacteriota bacterium]
FDMIPLKKSFIDWGGGVLNPLNGDIYNFYGKKMNRRRNKKCHKAYFSNANFKKYLIIFIS